MASFSQNVKTKMWTIRFRIIENGLVKQKRLSGFRTKKEANEAQIKFLSEHPFSSFKISKNEDLIFENVFKKYLAIDARSTKPSTHRDKESIFKLYITPFFKNKLINNINKKFLHDWQSSLWSLKKNNKFLSYDYLRKIKKIFNHFLNWIEEIYSIPNQLRMIRTPKKVEPRKEMLIWELSEFKNFINNIDDCVWKTFFMFQFYTGSRLGETLALSDSDYINGSININKSLTFKISDQPYQLTATKNYKNRLNPLLDVINNQLKIYLSWKKENNISEKFLFGGNYPLAPTTIRRQFDFYLNKTNSNIDSQIKRIRIHDLRHSFVSLMANMGIKTKVIADLIGDTEETVIKTYKHLYVNDKKQAIKQANSLL